jgi:hypothetical protein
MDKEFIKKWLGEENLRINICILQFLRFGELLRRGFYNIIFIRNIFVWYS